MKTIYIILPVHNRKKITEQYVRCLISQTYQLYHLILIDDGSTDGTKEMVRSYIPDSKLTVITGKGNWWWGGGLHQGYKWIKNNDIRESDIALISNDDSIFDDMYLETALKLINDKSNCLVSSVSYSQQTGEVYEYGTRVDWKEFNFDSVMNESDINCLTTRGLFLTVGDFYKLGGFHPRLIPHFLADYEFTMRAKRIGFEFIISPELKLFFNEETSYSYDYVKDTLFQKSSFLSFLKILFSNKSPSNPVHFSNFIILACPWRWKLKNLYRVWRAAILSIGKHFYKSIAGK